jgi:choline dehydrogenase-like flavoprotein
MKNKEHIEYDVVIVGTGISGAVLAKTLTQANKKVLMLEAGMNSGINLDSNNNYNTYMEYLDKYYTQTAKTPNAPYPNLKQAPSVDVLDIQVISPSNGPSTNGYLVQNGPLPFASDCLRAPGGTTLHWLGSTPRMLPNDFKMKSKYGVAVDWPFDYEALMPYYEMAEFEIGVAGDVSQQYGPGVTPEGNYGDYVFPMKKIPQSYLDQVVLNLVKENVPTVHVNDVAYELQFAPTPQGRNSDPEPAYQYTEIVWDGEKLRFTVARDNENYEYRPIGAVWDPNTGTRCEGNSSCVPICPVQAKYNALKTLSQAKEEHLEIRTQCVASRVLLDDEGNISGIEYKRYQMNDSITYDTYVVTGKIYVLAASAFENAKILLSSPIVPNKISAVTSKPYTVGNQSDQVGRNIMDHLCLLTWGLLPEKGYPYRGPGATTNLATFRDGDFRKEHAAWICPIDNWGWAWPVFSPGSDLAAALNGLMFGDDLRVHLSDILPKQLLLHYECEQLPDPNNRLTIDPAYRDALGNCRPIITYDASDYMRKAFEAASEVNKQLFEKACIEDHTRYSESTPDYVNYNGKGYNFWGAGHVVGTHRMGKTADDSVVNENMQVWGQENLYLVGCGNMPTLGTSNPTLTMTALTFKAAEAILNQLENQ